MPSGGYVLFDAVGVAEEVVAEEEKDAELASGDRLLRDALPTEKP